MLPLPLSLTNAQTVAQFAQALAEVAWQHTQAHGAQVWIVVGGSLRVQAEAGRGASLSGGGLLAGQALESGVRQSAGMLSALPFGCGVLELIGADPENLAELSRLMPLLGLALEGVQAREAGRGAGRISATVEALVRRLGGSLDLPDVLTKTAESAALALGFGRAFVGLFSELGETEARTGMVYTYGFTEGLAGGIGVGPTSFQTLMGRGETIRFVRSRDASSPLGRGLAELNPEAAVIAPLSARGQALGLLYVDTHAPGITASDDDARLVLALAEQASLAIDNARLYGLETRKREAAEALRDAASAFSQSLHLPETLTQIVRRASELFRTSAAAVYELQPNGRTLTIRSALGLSSEYMLRAQAKVGAGVTGQVAQTREAMAVYDLPSVSLSAGLGAGSRYTRQLLARGDYPYRGVVGLPLTAHGGLFGVLTLYWQDVLPLDEEELALAQAFAAQASLATENARLYGEELRREKEAATLLELERLLGESQSQDALAAATRLCVLALGAGRGLLALKEGEHFRAATYNLYPPTDDDLSSLAAQIGRGPRPLTRRACLPIASGGVIVPLSADTGGLLGFFYADEAQTQGGGELSRASTLNLARSLADQMALTLNRVRLVAALEREEARYRQLTEGAHDPILSASSQGVLSYANPAARKLLGEVVGHPLSQLTSPGTRAELEAAWEAAQRSAAGGRAEVVVAGVRLEVRLSHVASSEGESMLLIARDLSEVQRQAEEIARRGQALEAATSRTLELRSFLALFTQAQEEERQRISRELHDDTAQVLIATSRRVARLARELEGEQKERAQDITADLHAALESVRRFARNLRPSVLDDLGLLPALEWLAGQARTPARLEVSGSERRLPPALELTIFRLSQEALNNVDKHAGAQSAAIRVTFEASSVRVAISDDGQGFSAEQAHAQAQAGHLGLIGLRERVSLAGGTLEVSSEEGAGTIIEFVLPTSFDERMK